MLSGATPTRYFSIYLPGTCLCHRYHSFLPRVIHIDHGTGPQNLFYFPRRGSSPNSQLFPHSTQITNRLVWLGKIPSQSRVDQLQSVVTAPRHRRSACHVNRQLPLFKVELSHSDVTDHGWSIHDHHAYIPTQKILILFQQGTHLKYGCSPLSVSKTN